MEQQATAGTKPLQPFPLQAWILGGIFIALFAYVWRAPMAWMYERWMEHDSYYSHGVLVPFVALYFVWRDRHLLAAERGGRSALGLSMFLFGLVLLAISGFLIIYFLGMFAFVPALWGLCGYLFGPRVMRRLALPMFILLFMIPPPLELIDRISNNLKLFVAEIAITIFNVFGITSVKDGATIYLGSATVTVGNACSGLRSLISLLFLGVLFAAASGLPFWRRVVLFLASMPIAIISNVARVLVLCFIAYQYGNDAINAKWGIGPLQTSAHDASGYLIFVVAFILLLGVLKLLSWRVKPAPESAETSPPVPPEAVAGRAPEPLRPLGLRLGAAFALLVAAAAVSATTLYQRGMEVADLRTPNIPLIVGQWIGAEMAIEADVKKILETNDVVQRSYRSIAFPNRPVQLAVVYSPTNRRVAHPPEVCYTNVGWEVSSDRIEQYEGIPEMVRLTMSHSRRRDIVIYTFLAGQEYTASYYRQQYNIARNHIMGYSTSSALIRISTTVKEDEREQDAEARLLDFARAVMPEVSTHLK